MALDSDIAIVATDDSKHSYVDWPAIIAGVVLASAISIVLLTFGSAIGLSFTNFTARPDVSPIWVGIAAASWLLWVEVSSFMAGGYLTGRLRRRIGDATEHEVDVRDGAHGLLVWAGAMVVGAVLAVMGVGAAANAVGSAAATVTTAASNVAGGAAEAAGEALDPNAYFIDTLFRRAPATAGEPAAAETPAAETPAATPAATTTTTPAATTTATPATTTTTPAATTATPAVTAEPAPSSAAVPADTAADPAAVEAARGEAGRILAQSALSGSVSDDDRAYLGQLVAENTGLSEEEATARVDQVMTSVDEAKAKAAEAAETARKTGILAAFLIAASFLVSGAGAYWAAIKGGNHRDQGTVFPGFNRY